MPPPALARAGVGRRALAALIDLAIVIGGMLVAAIIGGGVLLALAGRGSTIASAEALSPSAAIARAIVQLALYGGPPAYLYLTWRSGASVGMRAMHCRLRSADGVRQPSAAQLVLRLCGLWWSVVCAGIGLLWGVFRADRRGWPDLLAGTQVVHEPPHPSMWWLPQPPPVPSPPQVVAPRATLPRTPWTWTDVVPVVILTLPLSIAAQIGTVAVLKWALHDWSLAARRPLEAVASDITAYGAVILLVLLLVKVRRHATLAALGVRRCQWRWIAAALPFAAAVFVLSAITGQLGNGLFPGTPQNQCVSIRDSYGGVFAFAVIGVAVVAPLAEEIIFRGMVFGWLRTRINVPAAVFISAALFSLEHIGFLQLTLFLPTFAAGVLLAVIYHHARSIWPNVLVHGLFNLSGLLILYTVANC